METRSGFTVPYVATSLRRGVACYLASRLLDLNLPAYTLRLHTSVTYVNYIRRLHTSVTYVGYIRRLHTVGFIQVWFLNSIVSVLNNGFAVQHYRTIRALRRYYEDLHIAGFSRVSISQVVIARWLAIWRPGVAGRWIDIFVPAQATLALSTLTVLSRL